MFQTKAMVATYRRLPLSPTGSTAGAVRRLGVGNHFQKPPEVSFAGLANGSLDHAKTAWNGFMARLDLLRTGGIRLPATLDAGKAQPNDVLDAAVGAWSSRRKLGRHRVDAPGGAARGAGSSRCDLVLSWLGRRGPATNDRSSSSPLDRGACDHDS